MFTASDRKEMTLTLIMTSGPGRR